MNNIIRKGSSISISTDIDEIKESFFGYDKTPKKYLIVEGATDKQVIETYFYLNDIKQNFEIRTGSPSASGGKRKAIQYFEENRENGNKRILCLLDRDYDFILELAEADEDILYYDYFELESYLFDEDVLKPVFTCIFKDSNRDFIRDQISKLNNYVVENDFYLLYLVDLFREAHYHELTGITLEYPQEYADFCKRLPFHAIINGKIPATHTAKDASERIEHYLANELESIEEDLFKKIKMEAKLKEIHAPQNFLDFCKKYYKGKKIIKNFKPIFSYVLDTEVTDDINIYQYLFNVGLERSKKFETKMQYVKDYFSN